MQKKILIHSIVFSPDCVSTAYLYNDIALKFKESGYEVVILTTTPHYNVLPESIKKQPLKRKFLGLFYESSFSGIVVKHVPQKKFKQSFLRVLGFIYWHICSFFLGLFEKKVDVILSPSPPLTIGFINFLLAKLKGAKTIYNVQEIYPDFLIEQGGLKSRFLIKVLKWLEKFVYNKSDAVTTIDNVFFNTIVGRFRKPAKLHVIPNFVDTNLYKPTDVQFVKIDRNLFPNKPDVVKVMYAGNIGHAQDWKPLIQSAIKLQKDPIEFFVIGEGVMKKSIQEEVEKYQLKNIHILQYQPRELMPSLIAYADLQFIFMSKEMEGHGFPSKVYTIMACGKPLLICSGVDSPIYNFLENIGCAHLIPDNDINSKTDKIVSFLRSTTVRRLEEMGQKGLKEIQLGYANNVVTQKYVQLVDNITGD